MIMIPAYAFTYPAVWLTAPSINPIVESVMTRELPEKMKFNMQIHIMDKYTERDQRKISAMAGLLNI